jgi:hypothetical protein
MELIRNWWFWPLVAIAIILTLIQLYLIQGFLFFAVLDFIPTYQCGSTMSPAGPVSWCGWYKGIVVG